MTAIEVRGLRRSYPATRRAAATEALAGIDLVVAQGEVHGLLGPNGAGKTTLIKILTTILLPTEGGATVLGHDVMREANALRGRIGLVFGGERGLYGLLTARENLDYWAAVYGARGRRRGRLVTELLDRVGLAGKADVRVDRLSRGMKQRLHLARGLVGDPEVLFLDEPTVGMDPVAAHEFRELVRRLRAGGVTILLCTHDMREAEAVCDRVTLLDRGRVFGTETPERVGRWIMDFERVDARHVPAEVRLRVLALPGVRDAGELSEGWVRFDTTEHGAVRRVLETLVAEGITSLRTSLPNLEDVYLTVIGNRGLRV